MSFIRAQFVFASMPSVGDGADSAKLCERRTCPLSLDVELDIPITPLYSIGPLGFFSHVVYGLNGFIQINADFQHGDTICASAFYP